MIDKIIIDHLTELDLLLVDRSKNGCVFTDITKTLVVDIVFFKTEIDIQITMGQYLSRHYTRINIMDNELFDKLDTLIKNQMDLL